MAQGVHMYKTRGNFCDPLERIYQPVSAAGGVGGRGGGAAAGSEPGWEKRSSGIMGGGAAGPITSGRPPPLAAPNRFACHDAVLLAG